MAAVDYSQKIISLAELSAWRDGVRAAGQRLVVTNGVFDLMHRGHATYLNQAAALGDRLLVLINDDQSVRELKGPTRPILGAEDRAFMLAALQCVDGVCVFPGKRCAEALTVAQPDLYVKGGDYTPESLDRQEYAALQQCGSEIRILPLQPGCSSSGIIRKIQQEQRLCTVEVRNGGTVQVDGRLGGVFGRRSIRQFQHREVTAEEEKQLLMAAMAAPSARSGYPLEVIVLRDAADLAKAAQCLPNGGFLKDAPLGFILCGNINRACGGELSYLLQDCSAAMENLLVAAHALGMEGCWLGIHPRQERMELLRQAFAIPEDVVPVGGVAIGWPMTPTTPRTAYDSSRVHQGGYGA